MIHTYTEESPYHMATSLERRRCDRMTDNLAPNEYSSDQEADFPNPISKLRINRILCTFPLKFSSLSDLRAARLKYLTGRRTIRPPDLGACIVGTTQGSCGHQVGNSRQNDGFNWWSFLFTLWDHTEVNSLPNVSYSRHLGRRLHHCIVIVPVCPVSRAQSVESAAFGAPLLSPPWFGEVSRMVSTTRGVACYDSKQTRSYRGGGVAQTTETGNYR